MKKASCQAMMTRRMPIALLFLAAASWFSARASAQTPEQISLAFRNVRSDDIPHNADAASDWIYAHRNPLKSELLDELYRTDRQGRDVILFALMNVKGFDPDERFRRLLVSRLNEEDHFVRNSDLHLFVHWYAWRFINAHYGAFKALILENLQGTNDMLCIWQTARQLQRQADFIAAWPTFPPPHVWETAALSLRNDEIGFNASQAIRFYLMVGKGAIPHLRQVTTRDDAQARDYASATIDAIGGSRNAYGYLGSEIAFASFIGDDNDGAFGLRGGGNWLSEMVAKWKEHAETTNGHDSYRR